MSQVPEDLAPLGLVYLERSNEPDTLEYKIFKVDRTSFSVCLSFVCAVVVRHQLMQSERDNGLFPKVQMSGIIASSSVSASGW
jgi:hypothetical protein